MMDQTVYDALYAIMVAADLPEDSSAELAFHVALHYPEHGAAILAAPAAAPTPDAPSV